MNRVNIAINEHLASHAMDYHGQRLYEPDVDAWLAANDSDFQRKHDGSALATQAMRTANIPRRLGPIDNGSYIFGQDILGRVSKVEDDYFIVDVGRHSHGRIERKDWYDADLESPVEGDMVIATVVGREPSGMLRLMMALE